MINMLTSYLAPFPSYGPWLIIDQIFASKMGVPQFNALARDDPLPISPSVIYL